ncbi:bifunctional methylenetetrahydrofolate dehydrogenase/methenyltetrahydrofolate cyclohydrolase FolD [Rossellomorea vietnamensis]|uniref:Bifunctional methylenetetrahydrofolate dehydrogenase/methenyltetrahydrofolate cyclohydrolase FolD n=1 Tax=Rossellomorea vietnamensis TaxID=218284 RepID=A0ACD4C763_9BACI|nr:bifunctional methylenetetrahydrofolate dehydrogenase/methenyltetrahydrofolate cyclohydrolase FolD [Rossellomorea vietnamensis]UXH44505.1 bifunctional methylenetetrahydrofolate dehydrogenase/methenyltetrahydrofolate cyclohydrolase FolD [Rossellomorea vietnamensis]WQI95848.1 bifunctional methylenetetrahydrofolate dehydrogenase/methenyltetrahydrofolate cyclohydrolase FolD [Rossellomorea vietnamensis]
MSASIIDGKLIADHYRQQLKTQIQQLKEQGVVPGLAVILVGDNHASHSYVKMKRKACSNLGIHSELYLYESTLTQEELLGKIRELNEQDHIHGILVQLPLPEHINPITVIETISPSKDVDGFHPVSIGKMVTNQDTFYSCTPLGVMKMLEYENIPVEGKHVVILGRSNIVGKPAGHLFLNRNATVTYCHSKTDNMSSFTQQADIIVSAVGKANLIGARDIKPGAVIIDVGMNRNEDGKLCGDVNFEEVKEKAGKITPVPGGVGPMTITMLLYNTVKSAEWAHRNRQNG